MSMQEKVKKEKVLTSGDLDYASLVDEIYQVYEKLREHQRQVVFLSKSEYHANEQRKTALAYVTEALHEILKKCGDTRIEEC